MRYLIWSLPAITIISLILFRRASIITAAAAGLVVAMCVALFFPPAGFSVMQAGTAIARGAWICWTVMPYILGGLLFWQIAAAQPATAPPVLPADIRQQRRLLYFACFLIGPFAESATGFGVGMLSTIALIRVLNLPPAHMLFFGLMSQILIPWGGMGSGTLVGSAMAGISATDLAFNSTIFVAAIMVAWLPLFWRVAHQAGLGTSKRELLYEALWMTSSLGALAISTAYLGPEVACLAAFAPFIAAHYLLQEKPTRAKIMAAATRISPYMVLIIVLVSMRVIVPVRDFLTLSIAFAPYPGLPVWMPLFHAGTWLVVLGLIILWQQKRLPMWKQEATKAWISGRGAVYATFLFSIMAEVLSQSGISAALAAGMYDTFKQAVILFTPVLSGTFGLLSNSGNASNGLFMSSQVTLAQQSGLSVMAVVALQHVSSSAFSLFSPVRMSMAASIAQAVGYERQAYRILLPFLIAGLVMLIACAGVIMLMA